MFDLCLMFVIFVIFVLNIYYANTIITNQIVMNDNE
jgi:hypothetical protein